MLKLNPVETLVGWRDNGKIEARTPIGLAKLHDNWKIEYRNVQDISLKNVHLRNWNKEVKK